MKKLSILTDEAVIHQIHLVRGQKVMIDKDLAILYGVETKRLKEAVRRNISRFPKDFMFTMTAKETANWRTQIASSNSEKMGLRYSPYCFTEQGVTMLSCILNSERAVEVNIRIIRIFIKMREMVATHKDILLKLDQIEKKMTTHDNHFQKVFYALKKFLKQETDGIKKIGYIRKNEKPSIR
ncbi:MAG: ORF6N domain-containing protein [Bacteroidota bacterium]|nr:ORF6N domain-containing protein [Bacteroidota bacterium]